ncbi:MAG: 23S rRNA (uracil(1939)-C(5))-methyltransferase RlmD [Myxococcales bacterium]|nr:23S rRNA (uracil(1939)-C(5))-methyltransferase RlmD [Myxococcales bacterium]
MTELPRAEPKDGRRPRKDDVVECTIERIGEEGQGVAILVMKVSNQQRRFRFYVPGALEGERVRARVTSGSRDIIDTELLAILEASPHRSEPPCPHASPRLQPACGGCAFLALDYGAQVEMKAAKTAKLFPGVPLEATIRSPLTERHRNKLEFSFGPATAGDAVALGLRPRGFRFEVVAIEGCRLMSEGVEALVPRVTRWAQRLGLRAAIRDGDGGFLRTLTVRESMRTGERLVELTTTGLESVETSKGPRDPEWIARDLEAVLAPLPVSGYVWSRHIARRGERSRLESVVIAGRDHYEERLLIQGGPLRFEIHPRAFFQPNTNTAELLYAEVLAEAVPDRVGVALDLYCGTGTIALVLARRAAQVVGIELVPEAILSARRNAALNDLHHVDFLVGDVGATLKEHPSLCGGVDVVTVDPPRAGLDATAIEALHRIGAPRLVYVSCNPQSLVRDASALSGRTMNGPGYRLTRLRPVDQFPHTPHLELVATFERNEG